MSDIFSLLIKSHDDLQAYTQRPESRLQPEASMAASAADRVRGLHSPNACATHTVMSEPTLLPDGDALFRTFFYAWYDEAARARHPDRLRADVEEIEFPDGAERVLPCPLSVEQRVTVEQRLRDITEAAVKDLGPLLGARPPFTTVWLEAFDAHFDRTAVNRAIQTSNARDYTNGYLLLCCETGALLGRLLQQFEPCLQWAPDWPYWESALFDPQSGAVINPFHWAVRRMSEQGADDPLAAKVASCVAWLQERRGDAS